jgi:V8-like Glu-specific endopeptidase
MMEKGHDFTSGQADCLHKDGRYFYTITTTGGNCGSPLLGASSKNLGKVLGIHAFGGIAKGDKAMNSALAFTNNFIDKSLRFWQEHFMPQLPISDAPECFSDLK